MKYFLRFVTMVIFLIIELGIVSNFSIFNTFYLPVAYLIYLYIDRYDQSIWWLAVVTGIALDIFSPLPIGGITIPLFITCLIIMFLGRNFLTNRSVYTVVFLGFLGMIIFKTLLLVLRNLHLFNPSGYLYPDWYTISYTTGFISEIIFFVLIFFWFHVFKSTQQH